MLENQNAIDQPSTSEKKTTLNSQWNGTYNRESGQKTLVLIGILITLVTVLSVLSLLMINKRSSIIAQATYTKPSSPNKAK